MDEYSRENKAPSETSYLTIAVKLSSSLWMSTAERTKHHVSTKNVMHSHTAHRNPILIAVKPLSLYLLEKIKNQFVMAFENLAILKM